MKQILLLLILIFSFVFSFLVCDSKNKTKKTQTATIGSTTLCDSFKPSDGCKASIDCLLELLKKARANGTTCDSCIGELLRSIGNHYKKEPLPNAVSQNLSLFYYKEAIRCSQIKKNLDSLGLAYSYYNLGVIYSENFKYDSAFLSLKTALSYTVSESGFKSDTYKEIGKVFSDIGDADRALEYFKYAIPYTDDKGDLFLTISKTYIEKEGYLNALKMAKDAQYEFGKQLRKNSNQLEDKTTLENLNSTWTNQGIAYRALNQLDSSFYCFNSALKISKLLKDTPLIANKYIELANNYLKIKDFNNAKENAERSLQLRKNLRSKQIESLRILGDIAQGQKKTDSALVYYQKTLHLLDTTFLHTVSKNANPIVLKRDINNKKAWIQTLSKKIPPLSNLYASSHDKAYLQSALQTCLLADTILQKLRREIYTEDAKFFWNENAIPLYENGIKLAYQLHGITGENDYLSQALRFFERTKSPVLHESLFEKEAKQTGKIPAWMLERERFLTQTITKLERETGENSKIALRDAQKALNNLQDDLKKDPTYKRFFEENYADRKPLSMQQLSDKVMDNQLVVSYFWGKDSVYIFSWSRHGKDVLPYINSIALTPEFKQAVEQFKNTTQNKNGSIDDFKKHAYRLFKDLLEKPIQFAEKIDSIKRITIIADGDLHNFPFEALTKKDISTAKNWMQVTSHCLVQSYAFSQALSVDKISPPSVFSSFFCAKPNLTLFYMTDFSLRFFKEQEGLIGLSVPDTVRLIKMFNKVDAFKEKEVQKDTFLQVLKKASVLYVSTHALADTTPLTSKIYFYPKDSSTTTDYYLTSREVYNAETKADLVVLSACQTAKGKIQQGEGSLSLARAFIFAGSRSLIVTQWQADNGTMNVMIPNFFENWLNHETKDIALQKEKIRYLNYEKLFSDNQYHPYFWAVTSVVGDLDYPKSNLYIWLLAAVLMVVIFYCIRQGVRYLR